MFARSLPRGSRLEPRLSTISLNCFPTLGRHCPSHLPGPLRLWDGGWGGAFSLPTARSGLWVQGKTLP